MQINIRELTFFCNRDHDTSLPAADWETKTCGVCCCCGNREGTQPSWEKLLLDIPELCSCCGFTLQMLGGSDADVVLVLKDDVV